MSASSTSGTLGTSGTPGTLASLALLCLVGAASIGMAQEPEPIFRSESDLVVLHVNVLDGRSDAVPGLTQDAFRIVENDRPQQITFFTAADLPVAAGLILDSSSSMIARHRMVTDGARAFMEASHPEDELFTLHFNEYLEFGLPPALAFTSRLPILQAALARYRAGGKTALHDAVIAGLDHLERARHDKRVLVVLSDGKDNASRSTERMMVERAERSRAIVYAVSNGHPRYGTAGDPAVLRRLVRTTGGVAYFPDSEARAIESFEVIATNIRRGYTIGYTPTDPHHDGSFRRVKVTVDAPGRRNLRVHSRPGYWTPHHADAR